MYAPHTLPSLACSDRRVSRVLLGLALALGCCGFGAALSAQQALPASPPAAAPPTALFGSTVEVREVEMEVHAFDRQGHLVEDLRAEDLALFQEGQAAEITGLRLVRSGRGAPAAGGEASGSTADATAAADPSSLHLVVFLDNFNLDPLNRRRAVDQLEAFLDHDLSGAARVMVVTYGQRLQVVQPFTSDRKKVVAALRDVEAGAGPLLPPRVEEQRMMQDIQHTQQALIQQAVIGGRIGDGCTIIEDVARNYGAARHQEVRRAAQALESFVTSLTGMPGRKAILHVSDGIPLIAGFAPLAYVQELCDGSGLRRGVPFSLDLSSDPHDHTDPQRIQMAMASFDTTSLWSRVAAHANLLGVTFYTLHAAGLESISGAGAEIGARVGSVETQAAEQRNRLDTLVALAEDTGGRALVNRNDLAAGLAGMMADLQSYYVLSFRPPAAQPGAVHKVRLESARPGVRLRYSRNYHFRTQHEQVTDRLIAAVLHDAPANPLGMTVGTSLGEVEDGQRAVRVKLSLPMENLSLFTAGEEAHGLFTVFVALLRADGAVAIRQTTNPLAVPLAGLAASRQEAFVHEIQLTLPPGDHVLGLGVLDEVGHGTSVVRTKLKV